MKKIIIVGSAGAGKSTLAVRLGEIFALPVIHLDGLFWKPGWVATPNAEWDAVVTEIATRPEWVIDGNYARTMRARLAACDMAIFLNIPRWLCIWRVLKRRIQYHGTTRPDLASGCPEQVDYEFLNWIWTFPSKEAPQVVAMLEEVKTTKKVVILRSSAEVEEFLNSFK